MWRTEYFTWRNFYANDFSTWISLIRQWKCSRISILQQTAIYLLICAVLGCVWLIVWFFFHKTIKQSAETNTLKQRVIKIIVSHETIHSMNHSVIITHFWRKLFRNNVCIFWNTSCSYVHTHIVNIYLKRTIYSNGQQCSMHCIQKENISNTQ